MPAPPLKTLLLLDGGDPAESREAKKLLGRLDGQTTNPTLIARNPELKKRIDAGERLSREEANEFYRKTLLEIEQVTSGPLSVEVYADEKSAADELFRQGKEMYGWIQHAYVKYPTTAAGLEAAERSVREGMRVNMTLCFTQEQAAAVYSATKGSKDPCFVSPFVGRLDDKGENGMDLIVNILKMLEKGDGHLHTLTASVRTVDHLLFALALESPLVTAPFSVYEEWAQREFPVPDSGYRYAPEGLEPIPYREVPLDRPWRDYDIHHELTDAGQRKFAEHWTSLLATEGAGKPSSGA